MLQQLFQRNFPDYTIGFNLNIPIRNRAAQANVINDQLTLRQQQLLLQRQENQVRVDVQNALIGVQQTRGQYQAATKAQTLQEQTLDAEQKKYALGASTIYNVILALTNLTQSQAQEVAAWARTARRAVELQRATGQLLNENNISLAEAYRGSVARPPNVAAAVSTVIFVSQTRRILRTDIEIDIGESKMMPLAAKFCTRRDRSCLNMPKISELQFG